MTSIWYFLILYISLLKLSSSILLPRSMSVFTTMNSLLDKLLISIKAFSSRILSYSFIWITFVSSFCLILYFCVLGKIMISPSIEGMVIGRQFASVSCLCVPWRWQPTTTVSNCFSPKKPRNVRPTIHQSQIYKPYMKYSHFLALAEGQSSKNQTIQFGSVGLWGYRDARQAALAR